MKIEDRNKKFYTDSGLIALKTRIKSWVEIYNKNVFPIESFMLGFGKFSIKSKEECESRIKELCELIGGQCKKRIEIIKTSNGTQKKEVLIYK